MGQPWYNPQAREALLERKYGSRMAAFVMTHALEFLTRRGKEILNRMAHTHETGRDTGAQENSYVLGIYLDGELVMTYYPAVAPQRVPKNDKYWGRREALDFLEKNNPEEEGIVVVFVQGMWYSYIQQELGVQGKVGVRYWQITTQCDDAAEMLCRDFNAKFPNMPCRFARLQDQGYI